MSGAAHSRRPRGLLRVAGLPIRFWLAATDPGLAERVRRLVEQEDVRTVAGARLAEQIGERLVPRHELSRADRAQLLDLRRRLHNGELVAGVPDGVLDRVASVESDLAHELAALPSRDAELACSAAELEEAAGHEEVRLAELTALIRAESEIARALLPVVAPPPIEESAKSRRHRFEHEWRHVVRATTNSTPRGWYSHVGVVTASATDAAEQITAGTAFSTRWTENVRTRRRAAAAESSEDWPEDVTPLALDPLQWATDDLLVTVVLDRHEEPMQASIRRTPLVEAVRRELAGAPLTFESLARRLGCEDGEPRAALRGFVRHLALLGVVTPGVAPRATTDRTARPQRPAPATTGWLDVYRDIRGVLPDRRAAAIEDGVQMARRLLALRDPSASDPVPEVPDRVWTLADVLRDELAAEHSGAADPDAGHGSPTPTPAPGPLATFLDRVLDRTAAGRDVVVDAAALDEAGAPPPPAWPVDCLLRLPADGAGYPGVVDKLWPAGALGSRFAEALRELDRRPPDVEEHRAMLRHVEELTGFLVVEILAPPLSDGAANAVRRPAYTRAWTGDPHAGAYVDGDPGRYVPLGDVVLRRNGGRLTAEAGGRPIWPVHHATRSFSPPWDRVARILLAAAPLDLEWSPVDPAAILALPPGRSSQPRVTVAGGLVVAPAQWRVTTGDLWDVSRPLGERLRALARWRARLGLPRWVHVVPSGGAPVPCDLDSVLAVRTVESAARRGESVRIVETVPAPDELLVADSAHAAADRLVSQLQLRVPVGADPRADAHRIAAAVVTSVTPRPVHAAPPPSTGSPGDDAGRQARVREPGGTPTTPAGPGCRDPPAPGAHHRVHDAMPVHRHRTTGTRRRSR